jgi:hypothetical protein
MLPPNLARLRRDLNVKAELNKASDVEMAILGELTFIDESGLLGPALQTDFQSVYTASMIPKPPPHFGILVSEDPF